MKRKRALRGRNHAEGYPGGLIADDDQLGAVRHQRRPESPKETHRTDRSSCLENPRPKGGIFLPFGETLPLIFTLNQNRRGKHNDVQATGVLTRYPWDGEYPPDARSERVSD